MNREELRQSVSKHNVLTMKQIEHALMTVKPEELVRELLFRIGEDPDREGLLETPKRYVKFLTEFLAPKPFNFTMFKNEGCDEMIIVKSIPFHSFCEHHIAVIEGVAHIAYIPDEFIVGLSKIPRTLDMFANRLQNQERITTQVAEFLMKMLNAKGVAVCLTAKHYCMEMRGVKKHDTWTTTTKLMGAFKDDHACRNEFMQAIK
jgi:GTP cyclohydrolase I